MQATNRPATEYLDGFIDEATAANFLCQSIRTIQKWRVTGGGPAFYKSGRSVDITRSYKTSDGDWKSTSSLFHSDLLNVAKCAERAEIWISRQQTARP